MIVSVFRSINRRGCTLIRARTTAGREKEHELRMMRIIDWSHVSFSMVGGKMVLRFTNNEKEVLPPDGKEMRVISSNSLSLLTLSDNKNIKFI